MTLVISDPVATETVSVSVADLELLLAVYAELGHASRYVEVADDASDRLRDCLADVTS